VFKKPKRPLRIKMKRFIYLIVPILLSASVHAAENFDITLKSKWCDLDGNCSKETDFGGKWILVGSITFKKRSKDPVSIENIRLLWKGDTIDHLTGSLYKKDLDKDFLPIEENLICDSEWNKAKQTLVLNFDEKENLGPTTVFYLVLTVPGSIEPLLKKGSFCIEEQCLPKPFKHCAQHEKLSLAINDTPTKRTATRIIN
jgi:hypothetical protein